jgi:hypothetical protein
VSLATRSPRRPGRTKPSWYHVSSDDRMIAPENEKRMATRMGAKKIITFGRKSRLARFKAHRGLRADRRGRHGGWRLAPLTGSAIGHIGLLAVEAFRSARRFLYSAATPRARELLRQLSTNLRASHEPRPCGYAGIR